MTKAGPAPESLDSQSEEDAAFGSSDVLHMVRLPHTGLEGKALPSKIGPSHGNNKATCMKQL